MQLGRALLAPVALAAARARFAPARWALPALGVALATALLGSAAGGGAVAGEQAARDAVARLAPAARAVRLNWSGGLPPGVDARARRQLRALTPAGQTRSTLMLATVAMRGHEGGPRSVLQLGAVAPLSRWVRLRSGRMPRSCAAARCEVLAAGGGSVPRELVRNGTRLVTVGSAALTSTVPLGFIPGPADDDPLAEARPKPLLLSADPARVDDLPGFSSVFRTQGWSAPLSTGGRPSWRLGELQDALTAARTRLTGQADSFVLDAPDAALALARSRAHEARDRVLLVGAGAAALLAAFVVLAASALRRDLDAERERLVRRGARRGQVHALSLAEAALPALVGVLAGAVVAVAVTAARAHSAGVGGGAVVTHVLLSPGAIGGLVGLWLLAVALLVLASRPWGPGTGRIADVVAIGSAGALALALSRGGSAGDTLGALLAPLSCLVAAIVVARLVLPALRWLEAAGRRGPLPLRLAALGLARAPSGPALTVAVVAVGCGLAYFATAYGATLHHGDRDQAAYRVPLDVTVSEGPSFTPPLSLASPSRWSALAGGGRVLAVQRASASVPRGAANVELPVLGVPASGLGALRGWRDGDASASRAVLARRLRPPGTLGARGYVVPAGARRLALRARTRGDGLDVSALLAGRDGDVLAIALGTTTPATRTLSARLPSGAAGRRLVALEIVPRSGLAATNGHNEAENPSSPTIIGGRLSVSDVRVDATPVPVSGWIGRGSLARVSVAGASVTGTYAFTGQGRTLLGPRQPGDGRVVPVVVDPATAASAGPRGELPLTVLGERVAARVVGTAERMPTVAAGAAGFVLADRAELAAALDARAPGSSRPGELWVSVGAGAPERRLRAALSRAPLSQLDATSRRDVQHALRSDPLARELVRTLVGAAAVALLLAALGVLVAVALALRDDSAQLFDLEALGIAPRALRDDVRLRAALLGLLGLAAGALLGVALVGLVVRAVRVTAAGVLPTPPLIAVAPWGAWGLIALAFLAAVALGVVLLTRRALAGAVPARAQGAAP